MPKEKITEVCASYSAKLNIGNYQSKDFFASRKEECPEIDALEVWKKLFNFCQYCVQEEERSYIESHKPENEKTITESEALGVIQLEKGVEI